jgi:hypothetical protein
VRRLRAAWCQPLRRRQLNYTSSQFVIGSGSFAKFTAIRRTSSLVRFDDLVDRYRIPVQSLTTLMVLHRCHIEAAAVGIDTVVELKVIA